MWRSVGVFAASALYMACTSDDGYRVRVHVPGGGRRAVRVEVSIIGSCIELGELGEPPWAALRTVEALAERAEPIGPLAAGTYGLYGRAWEAQCLLYAAGCAPVAVEAGGAGTLEVLLEEIAARGCDGDAVCAGDRCRAQDAGPSADRDAGLDGSVPPDGDAGPGCLEDGEPCVDYEDCCGRSCFDGLCGPPECLFAGSLCGGDEDCCGRDCGGSPDRCTALDGCRVAGEVCESNDECCSSACAGGFCQFRGGDCRLAGEICNGDDGCCGRDCTGAPNRCQALPDCVVAAELCESNEDCCSGTCEDGQCLRRDGCRPAGEVCGRKRDCCSNQCTGSPNRCALPGGCRVTGELCSEGADCCSARCSDRWCE
ncbi:MAG: hypothetical protein HYY06_32640 [Deltaproteobacteria bacterium]|nr:hypothetical protein [Deltaproteobacteria bacterium]